MGRLGCLRQNPNHEIRLLQDSLDLVKTNNFVGTDESLLLRCLFRLALKTYDMCAESLFSDTSTRSSNIAETHDRHSFVADKINWLLRPQVFFLLLREAFDFFCMVKHAQSHKFS
jgi:hypothetical protein